MEIAALIDKPDDLEQEILESKEFQGKIVEEICQAKTFLNSSKQTVPSPSGNAIMPTQPPQSADSENIFRSLLEEALSTYDKETKERQDKKLLDRKKRTGSLGQTQKRPLEEKDDCQRKKTTEKWKQNHDVPAEQNRKRIRLKERRDATEATRNGNSKRNAA